jgi:hypothetical protein
MQGVEIGIAGNAEHHGLAVEHEVCLPDLGRGLHNLRITVGPVVAAATTQKAVTFTSPIRSLVKGLSTWCLFMAGFLISSISGKIPH